jgi:L-rhamnose isomerase
MNDKERLENIKKKVMDLRLLGDSEGNGEVNINAIYNDMSWIIEQAEKVEQLQQENERLKKFLNWEQEEAQGLDEEVTFQLEQLKQAQAKVKHLENTIKETLDLLKRGGPGTHSKVQFKLEQVCNELEGDTQ